MLTLRLRGNPYEDKQSKGKPHSNSPRRKGQFLVFQTPRFITSPDQLRVNELGVSAYRCGQSGHPFTFNSSKVHVPSSYLRPPSGDSQDRLAMSDQCSKFPNTSKIHPSRTSHLGGFSERIRLGDLAANENVCKCHTKKSDERSGHFILLVAAVQMHISRLGHGSSLN
jgi:hypothetical protein